MADERSIENEKRARQYLRSNVFRVCSWFPTALIAAFFLVPSHPRWFMYAAGAISIGAKLPVLRLVPYRHRLDIHNKRDKRYLLFVGLYLAFILGGACLAVYFRSRH